MKQKTHKQSAFTLVEVMIASFLFTFITFSIMTYSLYLTEFQQKITKFSNLSDVRNSLYTQLTNDTAWQNTINDTSNSDFACLRSSFVDCASEVGTPAAGTQLIHVYDQAGNSFYDSTNTANGYTFEGAQCSSYSAASGTTACPYRIEVQWEAICQNSTTFGPCFFPLIKISVTFSRSLPSSYTGEAFNPSKYNFTVYRNTLKKVTYHTFVSSIGKDLGTNGGTCSSATWVAREFTSLSDIAENVTYASPGTTISTSAPKTALIVKAGVYDCEASAQSFGANGHMIRLQNTTTGSTLLTGSSAYSSNVTSTYNDASESIAMGIITLDSTDGATQNLELQHYCETSASADTDFGVAGSFASGTADTNYESYGYLKCVRIE